MDKRAKEIQQAFEMFGLGTESERDRFRVLADMGKDRQGASMYQLEYDNASASSESDSQERGNAELARDSE